jgi:CO/xanthine dehydrogenase Mo-binding subunit
MGLGYASGGHPFRRQDGKGVESNFRDYKTLTAQDMPSLQMIVADTFEPAGLSEQKG